jgi:nucleoside-diphosphate-sugar epimerase
VAVKVLVTGATGFVGTRLVSTLQASSVHAVRCAVRQSSGAQQAHVEAVAITDLTPETDWTAALTGIDTVVHLAARVHVMHDTASDPLQEFLCTNTHATLHLARQAAQAGVKRLIFLSSIKVNGEQTLAGRPFKASDKAAPEDAYAASKHRAELGLHDIAAETGLEVVVIRPPLVYGAGVKANFAALVRAVERGLPLPLGRIDNRRSLVGLDNLIDLIVTCLSHPRAPGQTFLVSDGEDLSTAELVRRLARSMGRPARLLPVPVLALKAAAAMLGKGAQAQRLCDDLQVDISATCERLGWAPPVSVDESLRRAVRRGSHP